MNDAAPAAGAEAEPAAEAERKKPLHRRLRRPPTALVVTLLGIALTAWLFPALNRQWEDRQKATDLKASTLDEIARGTANAFAGADSLAHGDGIIYTRELNPHGRAVAREWSVDWFRVDAKLRTYFDPHVEAMWADYDTAMRDFLLINEVRGKHLKGLKRNAAIGLDSIYMADLATAKTCSKGQQLPLPASLITYQMDYLVQLRYTLAHCDSLISDAVLSGHPRGYSTTTRDLIHDLIP